MDDIFQRTALVYGEDGVEILSQKKVIIFGVGGVGGYTAEAIARSGVGHIVLVDDDCVSVSNINRQIIALHSTLGMEKTEVMKKRILDINPNIDVEVKTMFFTPETSDCFDFHEYDYVVDAVDTVTAKIELIMKAQAVKTPIISSMGAGNKIHPEMFEIDDIYKTSFCPLARVMRYELKKRGVKRLTVVYSKEKPKTPIETLKAENISGRGNGNGKTAPGSTAFAPSVAGLIIASRVVNDLLGVS